MNTSAGEEKAGFEEMCRFVIKLGTLAHGYGPQAKRLESYLGRITEALGYRGIFLSTPVSLSFTFCIDDKGWQKTHLVVMEGTGFNLAKLASVGELVAAVVGKRMTLPEATARLDEIDTMSQPFGRAAVALGYVLCGAGFAGFLRGSWWDITLSALLSIGVYLIVAATERASERIAQLVPFLCAFFAGVLSALISTALPGIQAYLVTLSAIIYLIPGFSISMGIIELTSRHVVSGLINLVNGLLCLVMLFAGAWVGISSVSYFLPVHSVPYAPVSAGLSGLGALLLAAGLCIVFQTPIRDFMGAMIGCVIAYGGVALGESIRATNLGNLLGTVFIVLYYNIWSERTGRPASIVLLPSVVFMVSGSIGFRGLVSLASGNTALGQQEFIQMFVVAFTIAMGMVIGNALSRPRVTL